MLKIKTFMLTGVLSTSALLAGLNSTDSMAQPLSWQNSSPTSFSEWMFNKEGGEEKGDKTERKEGKKPKGPPQEAVDACKDKGEGEICSFEGKRGKVEGVCKTHHEKMSCIPERKKGGAKKTDKPLDKNEK